MTRRALLLALVGLALALGLWGFLHYFEWQEEEITLPPRGEARYNPLFALGKTLRLAGHEVEVRATLDPAAMALAPGELLLLASDVRTLSARDARALHDWVERGGQLVFELPPASERPAPLLARFDLALEEGFGCVEWAAAGESNSLCGWAGIVADDAARWEWVWRDDEGVARMAQARLGEGRWLALPGFEFATLRALENRGNAALAWTLLQPLLGEERVHVVYAVDLPPLYVLLVRHGWPVWVPALLALLAWLWRRSQRLGPLLPVAAADRRALLEHVRAAGEFALRRRRGGTLYAALRRRFDARLQRDAPLLAALEGEQQVLAVAQHFQLDPARVRAALQPADLTRPEAFAAAVRSLYQLQTLR